MAGNGFVALSTDAFSRSAMTLRFKRRVARCCGLRSSQLGPEADLFLRSRLVMTYPAVLPCMLAMLIAAFSGAAWARRPQVWLGFLVYFALGILSDLVLLIAHQQDGDFKQLRSWKEGWNRMSQPCEHWPHMQGATKQASETPELFDDESPLSWASGEQVAAGILAFWLAAIVVETLVGFFGACHLYEHSDSCTAPA
mmetsp:Transcript_120930/g.387155  ORF Transcript_120930/g.387155 Transcript_120930/m.387155 type:complete len:197 (-) Transcript_120930:111-701(-)